MFEQVLWVPIRVEEGAMAEGFPHGEGPGLAPGEVPSDGQTDA